MISSRAMNTDDDIKRAEAKRRAAEREAEMLAATRGSTLPDDPSLPPDARYLRERFKAPLELVVEMANDENLPPELRLNAAGKALAYTARQPAARQEVSISAEQQGEALLAALLPRMRRGEVTDAEVAELTAQLRAMPPSTAH